MIIKYLYPLMSILLELKISYVTSACLSNGYVQGILYMHVTTSIFCIFVSLLKHVTETCWK